MAEEAVNECSPPTLEQLWMELRSWGELLGI